MKKLITCLSFMIFAGILYAQEQQTPVVDQRQKNQRDRIQSGVASGELTRAEAAKARQDQRAIKRSEQRAKADGVVTANERARLNHKQNQASRQLRRSAGSATCQLRLKSRKGLFYYMGLTSLRNTSCWRLFSIIFTSDHLIENVWMAC